MLSVISHKLRADVLKTAHDSTAGHLGVQKTYDRVLCHFFGPKLKKFISLFIKTGHICQVIGKPNQAIEHLYVLFQQVTSLLSIC